MPSFKKALPHLARASASGANVVGSLVALLTQDKPNLFFYFSLAASSTYFASNLYEAYNALCPRRTHELRVVRIDSFVGSVAYSQVSVGR